MPEPNMGVQEYQWRWGMDIQRLTQCVNSMVIDPRKPTTLYAGTDSGVYNSTNGGKDWGEFNTGLTNTLVTSLAIDPQTPSILYAGTRAEVCFYPAGLQYMYLPLIQHAP